MVACSVRSAAARGRAIQLAQAFQSQPAIRANDDPDRVALPQAGLKQAIGRKPQGQAVDAATNRLLKMLVCSRGSALGRMVPKGSCAEDTQLYA